MPLEIVVCPTVRETSGLAVSSRNKYLTEKQKIMFDSFNVRDFELKSKQLVKFTDNADLDSLNEEFEIVKRELKNSANLIIGKSKKLSRQRIAFIVFFFFLWIIVYIYYSRGIVKRYGG